MATRLLRTLAPTLFASGSVNSPGVFNEESDSETRSYVILLVVPREIRDTEEELDNWYHSFLSGGTKPSSYRDPRITRTYHMAGTGIVANLSPEELKALEKRDEFVIAYPNKKIKFGLHQRENHGIGTIGGVQAAGDEGMPPPTKWE